MLKKSTILAGAARGAAPALLLAVLAALVAAVLFALPGLARAAGGPIARQPPPPVSQEDLPDPNDPEAGKPKVVVPDGPPPDPAQVAAGQQMYKDLCQKCHGVNMVSPGGGFFDLRTFPPDQKPRFVNSVTNGKRAMPAWGSMLKPTDIDTLWAYISTHGNAAAATAAK